MSLAESIKVLRHKAFLSQSSFAREVNVTTTTVNRWETGKTCPNMNAMKAIKDFCEKNKLPYSSIEEEWLRETMEEEKV